MGLDPELAAAYQSDPFWSKPQQPLPADISPAELARASREASQVFRALNKYYGERLPPASEYVVEDRRIPVDDRSAEIVVRIVRPAAVDRTYPVLVWFHGGGCVIGDIHWDDNHLRTISVDLQLATVNVEYRLAPEHPFPTPIEDCYAALKWVASNAAELHIALDKGLLVGGDSAGGNLAAAVALKARDDPFFESNPVTGQYLREPTVIHKPYPVPDKYKSDFRSFEEHKDGPGLTSEGVLKYNELYGAPPTDPRASPLLASSHAGLPPAFIQSHEVDPLRDDGVVYEKALREAGVVTRLIVTPGVTHGSYYTFPAIGTSVRVDRDARDGLKWLLGLRNKAQ